MTLSSPLGSARSPSSRAILQIVGVLVGAAAIGWAIGAAPDPRIVAGGILVLVLIGLIAIRPALGAWLWLAAGPLIVGMARGELVPFVRPNELLLVTAICGVAANSLWRFANGQRVLPKWESLDIAVGLLFVTGSIVPLLMLYGRGREATADDLQYALVLAKYFAVYLLFRVAVRTREEVLWCLRIALASSVLVGLVAILQVFDAFGVVGLLNAYYDDPFEGSTGTSTLRATSTIASAFGLADLMAMSLALAIGWLSAGTRAWPVLALAAAVFGAAAVAAGSFSGVIGCTVAVLSAAFVTRRLLTYLALLVPAAAAAAVVFSSVIASRLAGFDNLNALPRSWTGRIENLQRFFWPELSTGQNWIWGVRPAARVAAPETWRTWVYIESGHTWLLWSGGVALLIAFLVFTGIALRRLFVIARSDAGPVGIASVGAFAGTAMVFVLMLFDPHLTVRGSADLLFPLLALSLLGGRKHSAVKAHPAAEHMSDH